jgi:hypothetical protein
MITIAALSRNRGVPAVLIFKNVEVVSRIASGVPMMLTKLSARAKRIPARIMEKISIEEIDVLIEDPGPSRLYIPLPTKKNMARTNVS